MALPDRLPPLDSTAVLAILEANWVRWGWDQRYHDVVAGKLSRGAKAIAALDAGAAATIVSISREGCGWHHALKHVGVTQRRFFAWIIAAHSRDPVDEPYRDFCRQLWTAFVDNSARTGISNEGEAQAWRAILNPQ